MSSDKRSFALYGISKASVVAVSEKQALIDEALELNGILDDYYNNVIMDCSVTP